MLVVLNLEFRPDSAAITYRILGKKYGDLGQGTGHDQMTSTAM